jgi:hypothetical protein
MQIDRLLVPLELIGFALAVVDFAGRRENLEGWINHVASPRITQFGMSLAKRARLLFKLCWPRIEVGAEAAFRIIRFSFWVWRWTNMVSVASSYIMDTLFKHALTPSLETAREQAISSIFIHLMSVVHIQLQDWFYISFIIFVVTTAILVFLVVIPFVVGVLLLAISLTFIITFGGAYLIAEAFARTSAMVFALLRRPKAGTVGTLAFVMALTCLLIEHREWFFTFWGLGNEQSPQLQRPPVPEPLKAQAG